MAEQSLKDKTVKGVGWSAADSLLGQGVTFIVGIVLARLLSPEDYGLIGMVTIFTTILLGIVDCGFSNALIRKLEVTEEDYNTLFIVNMGMSVIMYMLLFVSSPLIAQFFERPQLVTLCRVVGLILIFSAFSIVQYTILSRKIDFKTKTKANLISAISSGVVGIGMALMGMGVWALVGQQLTRQFLYSVFLCIFNRWHPALKFSGYSLSYMWGFGWKLLLSGLLERLWAQLYQTVVGKFYSPYTLGQYTRAKDYASIFSSNLTGIVQRVSYPVLSQVQGDKQRMISAYRRVIKVTMFASSVCMISLGAISEPLIFCLIGSKWREAASYLPLICISMSLYPLHSINLNMLQIEGRTDIFLYLEIIKKFLVLVPLAIGIFIDIYWMLIGSIIVGIISFFLNSYYTGKKLGYSSWQQLKDIYPSYIISICIAIPIYLLKYISLNYWIVLPSQMLLFVVLFFTINECFSLEEYREIKGIITGFLHRIKTR